MYKICTDPNMENDNTEHIKGKRLSSILKAPRNPLDDLGNGNELTQDINIERRRKNSRRVSFANTIKVFESDLKNNTAERESTGMDTLLHAPIQASVQQTEWHDVDTTIQRTDRPDTTLIFSEENEMDMTASHTAVITRNLKNDQADKTEKVDTTSFLAGLNSNNGKAETSKEFSFFSDPANHSCPSFEQKEDATTVKKINFNEFLMSLKSNEKAPDPTGGPEKENVFFVPSRVSEDTARASGELVHSNEPSDTCNVTKFFRGQEDGMEMTKCQGSNVKAVRMSAIPGSVSSETVFRGDKTVVFSKCGDMEITGNYTDVICSDSTKETNNWQTSERQEKSHTMRVVHKVLPTQVDSERDFSVGKTVSSEKDFKTPRSGAALPLRGAEEPFQANASEPRKGSSHLPSFLEKSVVFPSGENMDLTGNCAVMAPDCNVNAALSERKAVPGYHVQDENERASFKKGAMVTNSQEQPVRDVASIPATTAVPPDKTIVFTHNQDDMEITASHTIAVNNNINGFENQE
ncbi:KNL1 protein, partial [Arenaria interpres]|nr:KNL1 protein [Arenaria interpres]